MDHLNYDKDAAMVGRCFKCPNGGGGWLYVQFVRMEHNLLIGRSFITVPSEESRREIRIKQDYHSASDITANYSEISSSELRTAWDHLLSNIQNDLAPYNPPNVSVG